MVATAELTPGRLVVAAIASVGLALGGCGGDDRSPEADRQEIRDVVREVQADFAAGDLAAVCESLTKDAQRHIGDAEHDPPTTCDRDIRLFAGGVSKGSGAVRPGSRSIERIAVDGDRATATVSLGGRDAASDVPLAREDGEWKVDGLYGGMPAGRQRDNYR